MENKNIWLISKYASPSRYGVGSRLYYIAKEFSRSMNSITLISSDSNHLATYPASNSTYNVEFFDSLRHVWIKTYKYKKSSSTKRFISWLDFDYKLFKLKKIISETPDVVIVSSLSLTSIIYGIYLKKKYKCKLIFEIRDIYPLTLTEELGFSKINPVVLLFKKIEKIGYKKADLIVGTMPNLVEHVEGVLKKRKNVFYSPLGIPEIWRRELIIQDYIANYFPQNKFIVGYAGSLGISNSLDSFVEAVKLCANKNIDAYFVFVGEGELKEKYRILLRDYNNVSFVPKINQSDVPNFLYHCDLLYLSTHKSLVWRYGQSMNKMIDYMMAGKPVVASYDGYQSMLNEANSGVFIPSEDVESIVESILFFMNISEKERNSFGKRGKEWILDNHNYQRLAKNYLKKIEEIL